MGSTGGYTGGVLAQPHCSRREALRQRSGPRKPCKGWSGWSQGWTDVPAAGRLLGTTLRARSPCRLPVPRTLRNAASWPIRATFDLFSCKVSQNGIVSPKYVEKASNSPCFQNGLQKSPLEKLRFPFSLAFSHKELLGPF